MNNLFIQIYIFYYKYNLFNKNNLLKFFIIIIISNIDYKYFLK